MMSLKLVRRQKQAHLPRTGRRRNSFKISSAMPHIPVPTIKVNPPDVVTITASSFTVDADKMLAYFPYIVDFQSVQYLIWKDKGNALVETVLE